MHLWSALSSLSVESLGHNFLGAQAAEMYDCFNTEWLCCACIIAGACAVGAMHAWLCNRQTHVYARTHEWVDAYRWLCNSPWSEHGVPFVPDDTGERWPLIGPNTCMRPPAGFKPPSQSSADLLVALRDSAHP